MNKRLQKLIDKGAIPNNGGVFIDSYNQSVNESVAGTITTRIDASNMSYVTEPKIIERDTLMKGNYTEPRICTMVGRDPNNPSSRARSDHYEQFLEMGDDVSNTLTSVQKDNLLAEPLRIRQATKQGYIEVEQGGVFDATYPDSTTRRGRVQEGGNIAPTLMASGDAPCRYEGVIFKGREIKDDGLYLGDSKDFFRGGLDGVSRALKSESSDAGVCTSCRIRKLTPRECFRLMGVDDKDIDTIQASGVSNSQQYKMAGNSIVVDCLYHLFRKMFTETHSEDKQLTIF